MFPAARNKKSEPIVVAAPRTRNFRHNAPRPFRREHARPVVRNTKSLPFEISKRATHDEIVLRAGNVGGPVPWEATAMMKIALQDTDKIHVIGQAWKVPDSPYVHCPTVGEALLVRHGVLTGRFARARILPASDFANRVADDGSIFVTNVTQENFDNRLHLYRYYPAQLEVYHRDDEYDEHEDDYAYDRVFFVSMREGEMPSYCFYKRNDDFSITGIVTRFYNEVNALLEQDRIQDRGSDDDQNSDEDQLEAQAQAQDQIQASGQDATQDQAQMPRQDPGESSTSVYDGPFQPLPSSQNNADNAPAFSPLVPTPRRSPPKTSVNSINSARSPKISGRVRRLQRLPASAPPVFGMRKVREGVSSTKTGRKWSSSEPSKLGSPKRVRVIDSSTRQPEIVGLRSPSKPVTPVRGATRSGRNYTEGSKHGNAKEARPSTPYYPAPVRKK